MDIILKIPGGDKCLGCMFLSINYFMNNNVKCNLFNSDLSSVMRFGDIDETTIKKCDKCPNDLPT